MDNETKNDINLCKLLERLPLSQKVDYSMLEQKLGHCSIRHDPDNYIQAIREYSERGILPREIILARVYMTIEHIMARNNVSDTLAVYGNEKPGAEKIYQTFKKVLDEYEKSMK